MSFVLLLGKHCPTTSYPGLSFLFFVSVSCSLTQADLRLAAALLEDHIFVTYSSGYAFLHLLFKRVFSFQCLVSCLQPNLTSNWIFLLSVHQNYRHAAPHLVFSSVLQLPRNPWVILNDADISICLQAFVCNCLQFSWIYTQEQNYWLMIFPLGSLLRSPPPARPRKSLMT